LTSNQEEEMKKTILPLDEAIDLAVKEQIREDLRNKKIKKTQINQKYRKQLEYDVKVVFEFFGKYCLCELNHEIIAK
jgi:hypothetical protein